MIFYRCKCGKAKCWSSMGPTRCFKCDECGSDLASGPENHREPLPHEFVETKVTTDYGEKTLTRCSHCMKTKAQIESGQ